MEVEVTSSIGSLHRLFKGNKPGKLPEVRSGLAGLLEAHLQWQLAEVRVRFPNLLAWTFQNSAGKTGLVFRSLTTNSSHLEIRCLQRPVDCCVDEVEKLSGPDHMG